MSSTVRTPGAFFASAALHAVLAVLVLWFTWQTQRSQKDVPPIFEMVAAEGDNYAATEAPALGTPGVKLEIPEAPAASPVEAAPPEPEPSPVMASADTIVAEPEPVPVPPKPAPVKPAPPVPKPVNLAKLVDRIADKRAHNIEKKFKQEQAAAAKEAALNEKRMTKAEFDRMNKGKTSPSQKAGTSGAISAKRIDTEGIAGGVAGGSTANKTGGAGGKVLTRQDIELSEAYISLLIQRLKAAHQKPEGLSDLLEATVKFRLTSSGAVTNVTIISSSRNSEFDASVLAAFRRITLPAPPANLKTSDYTIPFRMKEDS